MAKILGVVTSCGKCPNRQYYSGGSYECSVVQQVLTDANSIPGWCPLADHPSVIVAPIEKSLSNAKQVIAFLQQEIANGASVSRISQLVDGAAKQL